MRKRNPYNIQGWRPPQPGTQQATQTTPQAMPSPYAGAYQGQAPGNAPARPQEPAQAWQGNYTTTVQKTPERAARTAGSGKDMVLLISAILSTAWLLISYMIIRGQISAAPEVATTAEELGQQIGTAIGAAMMIPFLVITFIGAVFNWCAWGTNKKGLALTAGILFSISLIFGFSYALGVIPCVVLAFVGYSRLRKQAER